MKANTHSVGLHGLVRVRQGKILANNIIRHS